MEKEEILEKARKDDDEIEQLILTRSLGFSTIIIPIMCILFIIVRILNSEYMISDLVSITLAQLTISEIYQAFKIKKPILFVIGMITLILTIIFIISFLNEVII